MKPAIKEFRNNYYFLSNFYETEIAYKGIIFRNSEAAFQAMKDETRAEEFRYLNGYQAKKYGRYVKLRPDWNVVKDEIMYEVCFAKFTQNSELRLKLLKTGNAELIEGNTWNDTYWGICNGIGENRLGKILMRIRDEIKR